MEKAGEADEADKGGQYVCGVQYVHQFPRRGKSDGVNESVFSLEERKFQQNGGLFENAKDFHCNKKQFLSLIPPKHRSTHA